MNIIIALIVLGIIIIIHELGHFLAARAFGIPVTEFSMGMGPEIYSYQGEKTLYTVRAIPIGGYVSIEGMDPESKVENGFNSKKIYERWIVLSAGVFMNFMLSLVLIFTILISRGEVIVNEMPVIGSVSIHSKANGILLPKDRIVKINNENISNWSDIGIFFKKYTQEIIGNNNSENINNKEETFKNKDSSNNNYSNSLRTVSVELIRNEKTMKLLVPLTYDPTFTRFLLGITQEMENRRYSLVEGLSATWRTFSRIFIDIIEGFRSLFRGEVKSNDITGPLGIIGVVGEATKNGPGVLTWLVSLLSINIGIFNLLPFPALDGGRLIFLLLELIGIKINKKIEEKVHIVGMVILIALIIYITVNDVFKMTRG